MMPNHVSAPAHAGVPVARAAGAMDRLHPQRTVLPLTLTALGVVYGDIGTSPLYALRECFSGSHSVQPTEANVLGVLSLIIYSLLLVISLKYATIVMRADNQGEGGILALTSLLPRTNTRRTLWLTLLGIFGAALLYGDGMITPAITVLSAVEGVTVATALSHGVVVPIAIAILVFMFAVQRHGTHRIGRLFGPVMLVWFLTLAGLGLVAIADAPDVLRAIHPVHAIRFFQAHGFHGFAVLGAVFLVVTGGEALYADMGHVGKRPIRIAWFAVVLPALLMNYFGQGALLLNDAAAAEQPFFLLAPAFARVPLVLLATAAAIIASQALISGAFSLTRQAIQLGYSPRLDIEHTSSVEMGQVYVPQVNWALMIATIVIVLGFQTSASLAAAYGIAVSLTMVITGILLYAVCRERWNWPLPAALLATGVFVSIDLAFFGANLLKIFQGGWVPLVIAAALYAVMTTWKRGREILASRLTVRGVSFDTFMAGLEEHPPVRVPGTAVFMTAHPRGTPPALVHNVRHNKVLHRFVVILMVRTRRVPYVTSDEQVEIQPLGRGLFNVIVSYGFMQDPDVPEALRIACSQGLDVDTEDITYFLGRETIVVTSREGMAAWREQLFAFLSKNAVRATGFFRLPADRVVELGVQVEM